MIVENCYDAVDVCQLLSSGHPQYPEELHLPLLFNDEVNPEESRESEPALGRDASANSAREVAPR